MFVMFETKPGRSKDSPAKYGVRCLFEILCTIWSKQSAAEDALVEMACELTVKSVKQSGFN